MIIRRVRLNLFQKNYRPQRFEDPIGSSLIIDKTWVRQTEILLKMGWQRDEKNFNNTVASWQRKLLVSLIYINVYRVVPDGYCLFYLTYCLRFWWCVGIRSKVDNPSDGYYVCDRDNLVSGWSYHNVSNLRTLRT